MNISSTPQVVATLKLGKVLERKYRIFFWVCMVSMLLATVAFVTVSYYRELLAE